MNHSQFDPSLHVPYTVRTRRLVEIQFHQTFLRNCFQPAVQPFRQLSPPVCAEAPSDPWTEVEVADLNCTQ